MSLSTRILVIGAAGQVGSACHAYAISKNIPTNVIVRTPSKLDPALASNRLTTVIAGDATDPQVLREGLKRVTGVILAAPMGDMRGHRSGYEQIAKAVIGAVKEVQRVDGRRLKVWIMAGSAVLTVPGTKYKYASELFPFTFYPEYPATIEFLEAEAQDVDWSIMCPAAISKGKPRTNTISESIGVMPEYQAPFFFTKFLPLGYFVNVAWNWMSQTVTFETLAKYMVDNQELRGRLRHQRVGVLEVKK